MAQVLTRTRLDSRMPTPDSRVEVNHGFDNFSISGGGMALLGRDDRLDTVSVNFNQSSNRSSDMGANCTVRRMVHQ